MTVKAQEEEELYYASERALRKSAIFDIYIFNLLSSAFADLSHQEVSKLPEFISGASDFTQNTKLEEFVGGIKNSMRRV